MKTQVEFRTDIFPPYDGEENDTNPGRYGKRLADFLFDGLTTKGFRPQSPVPEDWGWIVPIENETFKMWIGCGNYDEYPDGFLCFIEPHLPTIRKFLIFGKIDTTERVGALRQAIDDLLTSEPKIRGKRWWSVDEFNNQSA